MILIHIKKNVIYHTIELVPNAKPYKKKQSSINLKIEEVMKQELLKLLDAKFIYPIKHSTWVYNMVSIRKENGEIILCVDLHNLNQHLSKTIIILFPWNKSCKQFLEPTIF